MRALEVEYEAAAAADVEAAAGLAERAARERAKVLSGFKALTSAEACAGRIWSHVWRMRAVW